MTTSEHTHCSICNQSLTDSERLGPATSEEGTVCGRCTRELEFSARNATRPPAQVVAETQAAELIQVRRENAKLLATITDIQDDTSATRAWVTFIGIVVLLSVVGTILTLFVGCLRYFR